MTISSSIAQAVLGDGIMGSCLRAFEVASQTPDTEARIYVRSLSEGLVVLDVVLALAVSRRVLVPHTKEEAIRLGDVSKSLCAVELTNGSLITIRKEIV